MSRFSPFIYVEHSQRTPTPITIAAFTGARWRFIAIPDAVLRRDCEAQRGWVAWRVRTHFRQFGGRCLLFGSIVGYRWQRTPNEGVRLDTRGRVFATTRESFEPPTGSIAVGNTILKVGHQGAWKVNL